MSSTRSAIKTLLISPLAHEFLQVQSHPEVQRAQWSWEISDANLSCQRHFHPKQAKPLSASFENTGHNTSSVCQDKRDSIVELSRLREIIINCGFHGLGLCQVEKTMGFNLLDLKCQIGPKHSLVLLVLLGKPSSWCLSPSVHNSAFSSTFPR